MELRVGRVASLRGELRVPSDKSLTHRAYMFGAIADGPSTVRHPLRGEDCEATLRCLRQLGLRADWISEQEVRLTPAREWSQPTGELDCGNSGTTMRLLSGLLASRSLEATLIGDASLSRRPMKRIAEPLRRMGATVEGDTPPLRIVGSDTLRAIDYASPVASAQIKSCVLLAGLRAQGVTTVTEPSKSRDHTERMLRSMGVTVLEEGLKVGVAGGQRPSGFEFTVPADISSAAFFMVAAAMIPEAQLRLWDVGLNPTRTGILDVFDQARVPYFVENEREEAGEPVGDIEVRQADIGMPFEISGDLVPRLIDEIPVLAVLATQLDGVSRIRDAGELRVKESDRIELMASGLRAMGAEVTAHADGLEISGPTRLSGATVEAHGDHRIAMAFAVAGLIAEGTTTVRGAEAIATSYPDFERDLWGLCVL